MAFRRVGRTETESLRDFCAGGRTATLTDGVAYQLQDLLLACCQGA
jgi:hypothetical protein